MRLNIENLLEHRGINQPYKFFTKRGFKVHTVTKLLNPKTDRIQFKELSLLCKLLRCTPNDLLILDEKDKFYFNEGHPMLDVKPRVGIIDITDRLRMLPLDQVDEISEIITKKTGELFKKPTE